MKTVTWSRIDSSKQVVLTNHAEREAIRILLRAAVDTKDDDALQTIMEAWHYLLHGHYSYLRKHGRKTKEG